MSIRSKKQAGITLTSLLLGLALAGIVTAFAVPSFAQMLDRWELTGVADNIVSDLRLAQSEAIANNKRIFVAFKNSPTGSWCYGIDDTPVVNGAPCDCSVANSCQVNGQTIQFDSGSRNANKIALSAAFGPDTWTSFNPDGLGADNGTITLNKDSGGSTLDIRVIVSNQGRMRLCSNSLSSGSKGKYQACP